MAEGPESILSHGERDVAGYLREGADPAEIATARDVSEESVEKAVDRVEEKTRRAIATLVESPFVDDAARELDDETRRELIEAFRNADD